jgi:AraC-like DNA-binding protein
MLDKTDLKMAVVAANYYRNVWEASPTREVPPAVDRLLAHLHREMSASGQELVVAQQEWLSTREVADRRGCSEKTAQRLARRIGRRFGRDWFVLADALPEVEENDAA